MLFAPLTWIVNYPSRKVWRSIGKLYWKKLTSVENPKRPTGRGFEGGPPGAWRRGFAGGRPESSRKMPGSLESGEPDRSTRNRAQGGPNRGRLSFSLVQAPVGIDVC